LKEIRNTCHTELITTTSKKCESDHMLCIKWNTANIKMLLADCNCKQYLIFCDIVLSLIRVYILRATSDKISEGLKARYMLYWEMPFDLVIRERLVGCTLVLTSDGTPSRQNLGPSGPQRIDFVLCNLGMLRQSVSRGTHWFTRKIEMRQPIGD